MALTETESTTPVIAEAQGPILLVVSQTRFSVQTVNRAIAEARSEGCGIHAVFILDSDAPERVFESLTDYGFTGELVSGKFQATLEAEYELRGKEYLVEIQSRITEVDIEYSQTIRKGNFKQNTLNAICEVEPRKVFLTRRDRSKFSRKLFGSAVADVCRQCGVPTVVVDEGSLN